MLISCITSGLFAQKEFTIYRTYQKKNKDPERLIFENIYFENTKMVVHKHFFSEDWFEIEYTDSIGRILAEVTSVDSLYYVYFGTDSAIVYSTQESKNTRNDKLVFNKKGEEVFEMGYLYKTNQIATYTRNTYQNDTLLLGSANYHITYIFGMADTNQTDSIFYRYDQSGELIGEYQMKTNELNLIDSTFLKEYEYMDTVIITWDYDCDVRPCKRFKRIIQTYDREDYIIFQENYDYAGRFDGTVKYTYEQPKGETYKVTQSIIRYNSRGEISETSTFRREEIKN